MGEIALKEWGLTKAEYDLVVSQVGQKGKVPLTEDELHLYLHVCKTRNFNALGKHIIPTKHLNKRTGQYQVTFITTIDALRLVADRTGQYAPGRPTEYAEDAQGSLIKATAYVRKFAGGLWHEYGEDAYWKEFYGQVDTASLACSMPHVMLSKCAEARAIRRGFPQETSQLYLQEEMEQAGIREAEPGITAAVIPAPKAPAGPASDPHPEGTSPSQPAGVSAAVTGAVAPAPSARPVRKGGATLPENEEDSPKGSPPTQMTAPATAAPVQASIIGEANAKAVVPVTREKIAPSPLTVRAWTRKVIRLLLDKGDTLKGICDALKRTDLEDVDTIPDTDLGRVYRALKTRLDTWKSRLPDNETAKALCKQDLEATYPDEDLRATCAQLFAGQENWRELAYVDLKTLSAAMHGEVYTGEKGV